MSLAQSFTYTDSGAPTLNGTSGSLKALLKTLLIGTSGVAYGSDGSAKAALGWSVLYETANKAVFTGSSASSQKVFRVDDSGIGAASYREAFLVGAESATDVDTLNSRFPTVVQMAAGFTIRKSQNLNSTAVPWWCFGDDRTVLLIVDWYGGYPEITTFGDFESLSGVDVFNAFIAGRNAPNDASTVGTAFLGSQINASAVNGVNAAYACRSFDGVTKSAPLGFSFAYQPPSATYPANPTGNLPSYPAAVNGGLLLSRINIHEINMPRGFVRLAYAPLHKDGFTDWAAITGVYGFAGAQFTTSALYGNDLRSRVLIGSNFEFA